jgi:S1-C subfamily serine protease
MWVRVTSGLDRGQAAEVDEHGVTLGSGAGCTITITDPDVAPLHASLRLATGDGDGVELVPIDDFGAVLVDGQRIAAPTRVTQGQRLTLGDVHLELLGQAPANPDPVLDEELAAALGSDGPNADDELGGWASSSERRRNRRATRMAAGALGVALLAGVLALTGVLGGDDQDTDVAGIVKDVTPSTVRVVARAGREESSGTGWVLDAREGLVVTNFHVVNGGDDYSVAVGDGQRDASIVGAAPCEDLAVLRVPDSAGLEALELADPDSVEQGEPVVAVGFAAGAGDGERLTSTTGVVSVTSQPLRAPTPDAPDFRDMLQTDAAINPGNSGGPLLDADRRVVGVNTAVLLEQGGVPLQNIGYAIGIQRVREIVGQLRRKQSLSWLGTGMQFPPARQLRAEGLPAGVVTLGAAAGTPAARAGLRGRSVLVTSVDGRKLEGTLPDYCAATAGRRTGDRVTLEVVARKGEKRKLPLRLG